MTCGLKKFASLIYPKQKNLIVHSLSQMLSNYNASLEVCHQHNPMNPYSEVSPIVPMGLTPMKVHIAVVPKCLALGHTFKNDNLR